MWIGLTVRGELTKRQDVKRPGIRAGGHDRNTDPEYFGLMGVAHGLLRRRHSGKGRAFPSEQINPEGIVMNTGMARRLALGDRVIWMDKDDCSPADPARLPASLLIRLRCFGRAKPRGATAARNCTVFDRRNSSSAAHCRRSVM